MIKKISLRKMEGRRRERGGVTSLCFGGFYQKLQWSEGLKGPWQVKLEKEKKGGKEKKLQNREDMKKEGEKELLFPLSTCPNTPTLIFKTFPPSVIMKTNKKNKKNKTKQNKTKITRKIKRKKSRFIDARKKKKNVFFGVYGMGQTKKKKKKKKKKSIRFVRPAV